MNPLTDTSAFRALDALALNSHIDEKIRLTLDAETIEGTVAKRGGNFYVSLAEGGAVRIRHLLKAGYTAVIVDPPIPTAPGIYEDRDGDVVILAGDGVGYRVTMEEGQKVRRFSGSTHVEPARIPGGLSRDLGPYTTIETFEPEGF